MESFEELFEMVKKYCTDKGDVSSIAIKTWIEPLEPIEFSGSKAVFFVQSEFQKATILSNYEWLLKEAFKNIVGFNVEIEIKTNDDIKPSDPIDLEELEEKHAQLASSYAIAEYEYTFDTFIVGRSNEFAYAACMAVAKQRGEKGKNYNNPLFIHGPSGLGKTHLLMAIAHEMQENNPNINFIYVTAEAFANELINAISMKDTSPVREKYRKCDLLLVDDIQFLSGRESTQTEFFHTFNDLYQSGKQIVMTSDRPPKEIKALEERMRNRFESGLLADVSFPDFETRIAIIKRKAELLDLAIPDDVAEYIANRLSSNIRQLEGAF